MICQGESYVFGNREVFISGQYIDTFPTINGCDSIQYLNLEVLPVSNTEVVAMICEGEVFDISGQSFTETGLYTLAYPAANGCDSLINIDLTVVPPMSLHIDTINQTSAYAGDLIVRIQGGTAPYQFLWSNGLVGNSIPVESGVTSVEVIDSEGCERVYIFGTVSTKDIHRSISIQVGPNPTQGIVTWNLDVTVALTQLEVRNMQGQTIRTETLNADAQGTLDLSTHPQGLYFLDISSSIGQVFSTKILLNK